MVVDKQGIDSNLIFDILDEWSICLQGLKNEKPKHKK